MGGIGYIRVTSIFLIPTEDVLTHPTAVGLITMDLFLLEIRKVDLGRLVFIQT